jgi:predicted lysophospholipase L1 biosynthesis ABC-type transport system permease subunit
MSANWEIGELKLRLDVVAAMALSSLRLRVTRAVLTLLTIATSSAFLMYLLTAPRRDDLADRQGWLLLVVLALVVSAAGVLNTMLMSVSQRYREIGTMKCLGALDRFVLLSVLLEAAILGALGGVLGVMAGFALGSGLAAVEFGAACWAHMNLAGLLTKALCVLAAGIGLTILGAAVPAWIASRMPPMEAMRGEK